MVIGTPTPNTNAAIQGTASAGVNGYGLRSRLRHDLSTFVVGASNQLAHNAACHVRSSPAPSTPRCSFTVVAGSVRRTCCRASAAASSSFSPPSAGPT